MATAGVAAGLIDTDILIDAERGVTDAVAFVASQQLSSGVHVSVITAMELLIGCRNTVELGHVRQFLGRVLVLPVEATISQVAQGLVESFCLSHGMQIPDALIAATAPAHGLPLFTKNVRHFQMVPRLAVIRPYL